VDGAVDRLVVEREEIGRLLGEDGVVRCFGLGSGRAD
jgi:hypothetical protein